MSESDVPTNPPPNDFVGESDPRHVLEQFVNDLPQHLRAIQRTLGQNDLSTLRHLVRQLENESGKRGLAELSDHAADLNASLDAHRDIAAIADEIRELAELCNKVRTTPAQ